MPIIAMRVVEKAAHEKTDTLFIYTLECPDLGRRTVVANLTNVYEVGDVAAVAQVGTVLPEGTIEPRKVFGVPSEGMAMGVVDVEPGVDVTHRFQADAPKQRFRVTVIVEVEGHYGTDAEKSARKALKGGAGEVMSVEPLGA